MGAVSACGVLSLILLISLCLLFILEFVLDRVVVLFDLLVVILMFLYMSIMVCFVCSLHVGRLLCSLSSF